jgi:hypothetical protein
MLQDITLLLDTKHERDDIPTLMNPIITLINRTTSPIGHRNK